MKSKKYNIFCKGNVINLIIYIFIIGLVFVVYNYIDNLFKTETIEGLTPTIDNIVNCAPTNPLQCGTTGTQITTYEVKLGTCEETYGPSAPNYDPTLYPTLLSYCVDEPTPNPKTPAGNKTAAVSNSICTELTNRRNKIQGELHYVGQDGKPC